MWIKILNYFLTSEFQIQENKKYGAYNSRQFNIDTLNSNLMLANFGIARASGLGLHRGLNIRFWAYLSKNPKDMNTFYNHIIYIKKLFTA